MKLRMIAILLALIFSGCGSMIPSNWGIEEGFVWCNARYLDLTSPNYQELGTVNLIKDKRFRLAKEGYIYALLGAYELQKNGKSEDKHFKLPSYIKPYESEDQGGFQATSFMVMERGNSSNLKEVVIAYRGTDSFFDDWLKHNLHPKPEQFEPAQKFLLKTVKAFPDTKVIVTGYSLGGGLAMNVLRNDETSEHVSQAWVFNTSPRTGEGTSVDHRLYVLSVQGELLNATRWIKEGPSSLGAKDANFSNGYNLINASSSYLHARWVMARQILIFADMAYYEEAGRNPTNYISPALEILKLAKEPDGCNGKYRDYLEKHSRL